MKLQPIGYGLTSGRLGRLQYHVLRPTTKFIAIASCKSENDVRSFKFHNYSFIFVGTVPARFTATQPANRRNLHLSTFFPGASHK